MALTLSRKPRLNAYTSVDIDYEYIRVAVVTRTKSGISVRAARRDLQELVTAALPENPQGSTLTPEATTLIASTLRELFSELKAPLTRVGVNSPDRNTILAMFNSPPLSAKDFKAAVKEHAASLVPNENRMRTGYHVLHRGKAEVTALISIINSPYADALASALRSAEAHVDLMQPRIISVINAISGLAELPEHPVLLAHISKNATGLAVLKPNRSNPNAKLLQLARIMSLGARQAIQQTSRYSKELLDTIAAYRANEHAPASIIITGRHHDHPNILQAAQDANLTVHDLSLPEIHNETPEVPIIELPALVGLALTRMNP